MTLDEARAQCKARGLGTSACLDLIDSLDACGPNLPTAEAGTTPGEVIFSCSSVPSAKKAAALLAESQAKIAAAKGPPWLLIGAGVGGLALVVWLATR